MRTFLATALLFFTAVSLSAQAKRPFTFEDMMKLKRVEDPQVSPDGKWVLFAAVDADLAANTLTPHVWVVPLGATHVSQNQGDVGHPSEREIISDQDADRPRWAPDGKRFAFISKKEEGSQVWIADFDAAAGTVTAVHKLTSIATGASGELWSPDGKNILFVSNVYPECDGTAEAEASCNAKKLEEVSKSQVKALVFDHLLYRHWNAYKEGKRCHLFVVSIGHVGADVSSAGSSEARQIDSSASPSRAGEDARPYTSIARDLTPGDYDAPPFSLGGQDNYAFSPDGQEICYASNHDPVPAISTNNDLFIVRVGAGDSPAQILAQTKNITADNKAADETPLYSPDGKYIAYRAQQRPGYESDRWRLMLYDRKTGEKKNLTEGFDRWVGSFTWARSSYGLLLTAEGEGSSPIYYVSTFDLAGRKLTPIEVVTYGFNDDLVVADDGKLLFTRMGVRAPNEIFAAVLAYSIGCGDPGTPGGNCTSSINPIYRVCNGHCEEQGLSQLAHLNDALLSQISMSPLEPFWFTGAHGDKVEGFLVKPPNFDSNKKYPVKFIVHGGPQVPFGDEWSYRWNFELFAANGYVVVFINFHGSPGYGQKFIDAINGDWGGAPFEDLMKGLDYAEEHYPFIDKNRECALGASFGGYMVDWILGHTDRFKCIVSHDGMFNTTSAWGTTEELWFPEWEFKGTPYTNRAMYDKWSPHLSAVNFKTPTLVIHSQLDYRLDVSEGFQLFTTLQRLGVPSKMLYFPDEGHWVLKPQNSQLWYKTVNDWVDQWIGK